MQPNPQNRPTAAEVLASGVLPPQVLDEQVSSMAALSRVERTNAAAPAPPLLCLARGAQGSHPPTPTLRPAHRSRTYCVHCQTPQTLQRVSGNACLHWQLSRSRPRRPRRPPLPTAPVAVRWQAHRALVQPQCMMRWLEP